MRKPPDKLLVSACPTSADRMSRAVRRHRTSAGVDPLGKQSGLPSPPSKMPLEKTGMYQLLKTRARGAPLAVTDIENQNCQQEKV